MDLLALIISIVSIVISIGVAIYEKNKEKKVNDINLNSEYLKDIYIQYLTKKIPKTRKIMRFESDILCDTNDFCNTLKAFLTDINFYLYIDKSFYDRMKYYLQYLEDLVMESDGQVFEGEERDNLINEIDKCLEQIYTLMNEKYINGDIESL